MKQLIEQLSIFMTLADKCHFGKTSEKHHITVSTLTRIIQRLERDLNVSLFKRNNRSVKLTQHGELMYDFAKEVTEQFNILTTKLNPKTDKDLNGRITLYSTVTAAYHILPPILKTFKMQFPSITTFLETGEVKQGQDKLLTDDIDFYIGIMSKRKDDNYLIKKIYETPLILITPLGFSLKKNATMPLILPEHQDLALLVETILKKSNLPTTIHSYVRGHEAILAMVSAGLGCAILPEIVVKKSYLNNSVCELKTTQKLPNIDIGLFVKNETLSPLKKVFWNFVQTI